MQPINIETSRGSIAIRNATLADVAQFRELRLEALQESPTPFPADHTSIIRLTFGQTE